MVSNTFLTIAKKCTVEVYGEIKPAQAAVVRLSLRYCNHSRWQPCCRTDVQTAGTDVAGESAAADSLSDRGNRTDLCTANLHEVFWGIRHADENISHCRPCIIDLYVLDQERNQPPFGYL